MFTFRLSCPGPTLPAVRGVKDEALHRQRIRGGSLMLSLAAALSRRWVGTAGDAERSTRAAAMSLYVGGVIVAGGALLVQFAPRTYPTPGWR